MDFDRHLESLGYLFYLASPNKTSFEKMSEVPCYGARAFPTFLILFALEFCVARITGRVKIPINETIVNYCQTMLVNLSILVVPTGQMLVYAYIHKHYKLIDLPWNSLWTWWACLFLFDLMFYWAHRAAHVVNIIWASHHTHHSTQHLNMAAGNRQCIVQLLINWILFLPVAFFIPGSIFIAHSHFNSMYQYWIHSEFIGSLGPLEYVLNTPSHHRVHHARNKKYIDKNFAGFLIIWDRMFGTFEPEVEEAVFGVTDPVNSHDMISVQFAQFIKIWNDFWKYKGIKNKLSVLFKGPGWAPGKPWCGNIEDIPDVKAPVEQYDSQLPMWCKAYVVVHFFILASEHTTFMTMCGLLPSLVFRIVLIYELLTLLSIGFLLDKRSYSPKLEFARCILLFVLDYYLRQNTKYSLTCMQARYVSESVIQMLHFLSLSLWISYCALETSMKEKKAKFFVSQVQLLNSQKLSHIE